KSLPHVGDVSISVEKVLAHRPDLIVASASANRKAIETLEGLGRHLPIFAVDPKTVAETYTAIRSLGQITGQTRQAEQVVQAMQARVSAVQNGVATDRRKPRVLIVVQDEPLMVAGAGNFMDDLVTLAGGVNVGRGAGDGWKTYSPERVVVEKPDVLIAG